MTARIGSLFSGAGGLDMAVESVFGGTTVWHSEVDPAASKVLAHRWPGVPNLGDITQIDWDTVEPIDILCGGFPCQDLSAAGNRAGIKTGTRSGLWSYYAEAIDTLRPEHVVIENVRGLLSGRAHRDMERCDPIVGDNPDGFVLRAAGAVLGDLADIGYDCRWATVSAASVGAPHRRERVFILASDTTQPERRGPQQQHLGATGERAAEPGERVSAGALGGCTVADASSDRLYGNGPQIEVTGRRVERIVDGDPRDAAFGGAGPVDLLPTPRKSDGDGGANPLSREERMDDVETRIVRLNGQWGKYGPAIYRWENLTRPAPSPTEPNTKGNPRLNPAFSEWLMGWPDGWVTNVPGISRNNQLRIVGNGVCPQQAVAAMRWLLTVSEMAA